MIKIKIKFFPFRFGLIFLDIISWFIALIIMLLWRLIAVKSYILEYVCLYACLAIFACIIGVLLGKYRPLKKTRFLSILISTILTWFIILITTYITIRLFDISISQNVLYLGIGLSFSFNILYLVGFSFWRYAQYMDNDVISYENDREYSVVLNKAKERAELETETIKSAIINYSNRDVLNYLDQAINLSSSNTKIIANTETFAISNLLTYRYDTIVNLKLLNDIRGINSQFCKVNEKLPDNGIFICCFRPQNVIKERIRKKYSIGLNYLIYVIFFLWRRVMPKLLTTSRLYFDITHGVNRVLSTTEVLGRLYYCGFEVEEEVTVGHIIYVKARRIQNPQPQSRARLYGPIIKLLRVGKNGKKFNVYKMRTMYPYSEFLQQYIFEKNDLQEGGKINNDIRISTLGAFMRKYWIDELPMFINFFKGDMKFVGVRPLSSHYFSLYSKELQEKRIKFKPGLFPPFYADMPKTLEEIQNSEMKYLTMCEQKGTFITDTIYMGKIFINIVIKKARSK